MGEIVWILDMGLQARPKNSQRPGPASRGKIAQGLILYQILIRPKSGIFALKGSLVERLNFNIQGLNLTLVPRLQLLPTSDRTVKSLKIDLLPTFQGPALVNIPQLISSNIAGFCSIFKRTNHVTLHKLGFVQMTGLKCWRLYCRRHVGFLRSVYQSRLVSISTKSIKKH